MGISSRFPSWELAWIFIDEMRVVAVKNTVSGELDRNAELESESAVESEGCGKRGRTCQWDAE